MKSGKSEKKQVDFSKIKILILDVDGVLTDGTIIINSDGTESKNFNVVDGHRIKMWQRAGNSTAIISGRQSNATTVRAEQLGITNVLQNCKKKLPVFELLLKDLKLSPENTAYVGDDLMDMPLVKRAGFGVAVASADAELKALADYVTKRAPGKGAVAEVIELILKQTGKWEPLMERYHV